MVGRQVFIEITKVVFTKLTRDIAQGFEHFSQRRILSLDPSRHTGRAYFGQTSTHRVLAGNKRRAPSGAALFRVIVCEHNALSGNTIDIRRLVAHYPMAICADIGLANIVSQIMRMLGLSLAACAAGLVRKMQIVAAKQAWSTCGMLLENGVLIIFAVSLLGI